MIMHNRTTTKIWIVPLLLSSTLLGHKVVAAAQSNNNNTEPHDPYEKFPGKSDCPCIDSFALLNPWRNCEANMPVQNSVPGIVLAKEPGVLLKGVCYPIRTYGSQYCAKHDMFADPKCSLDVPLEIRPSYCDNPFCYVDFEKCIHSNETFYRSNFLGDDLYSSRDDDAPKLFYSYSTCGSTADDWLNYKTTDLFRTYNRTIRVAIPKISPLVHYKKDLKRGILPDNATEYFDDSHLWLGFAIDYFNAIITISNIGSVKFVHRSLGSDSRGISSEWTRAISDVESGIADLSVGSFWTTPER